MFKKITIRWEFLGKYIGKNKIMPNISMIGLSKLTNIIKIIYKKRL